MVNVFIVYCSCLVVAIFITLINLTPFLFLFLLCAVSLIEDSPSVQDIGSPLARGGSFDIAASSVLPPYNADFMSFPSFSGAASVPDFGMGSSSSSSSSAPAGSGLGQPLSRMHSLDPNSYPPPMWSASTQPASSAAAGSGSGSAPGSGEGIASAFFNKVSNASSIPLLENTPQVSPAYAASTYSSFLGGKRGADGAAGGPDKRVKAEGMGGELSRLPSISEEGHELGDPLGVYAAAVSLTGHQSTNILSSILF
jgi:hypothetical protein